MDNYTIETTTLAQINAAGETRLHALLGGVFEHSPWVAAQAYGARPFSSLDALHGAMMAVVMAAPRDQQLTLIRAHPELAGREAVAGAMTADSTSEQGRLGLTALPPAEFARITALNQAYRRKFGFPCIVALKLHASQATVLDEMERRLNNGMETEMANALAQIGHITRGRLDKLVR
jgi:2-oxo-4-hydroxy-4-carboxy-5-ureidoimidazoline decarboxylase